MKQLLKIATIGIIAAILLLFILRIIFELTGNEAYLLLLNFDYVPIINGMKPTWLFAYLFHFLTCIISLIILFNLLALYNIDKSIKAYVLINTLGGGALFFLTALSNQPPEADDLSAWLYWTLAHGVYGLVAGFLIKKWV